MRLDIWHSASYTTKAATIDYFCGRLLLVVDFIWTNYFP